MLPAQRDGGHPIASPNECIGPKPYETVGMAGSDGISAADIARAYAKQPKLGKRSRFYTGSSERQGKPLFTAHTPSVEREPGSIVNAAHASGCNRRGIWTRQFSEWGKGQTSRTVKELINLSRKD